MHFLFLHLINSLSIFGVMPSRSSNSNAGGGRQSVRHERQPKANFGQSQFVPGGIFERRMFDSMNRKKNIFRDRWANGERKEANPTEPLGAGEIFEEELARQMREKNRNKPWEEEKENRAKSAGDEQIRLLEETTASSTRHVAEGHKTNPFRDTQFDQRFPVHNLCSPWSSGKQASDYVWAEPADKLLRLLNEKSNNYNYKYNMFLAPGQMTGHSTNVSIGIYIESMSTFKAQTMDFEVDMYFVMAWYDRRLAHNCTHPLLVAHKSIAERIWTPDLYFLNAKFAYLQEVTTPNFMLVIYPDGLVFKTLRIDVTLSCNMDLQLFPFDRQECPMAIQSYAYVESLVNLSWHVDPPYYPITTNPELKLNDMVITGMRFERCTSPYTMFRGNGVWSCLRGYIVMKRLVLFHLIQTYIPSAMLVSISWMTFWLDPRASPARISLTITSLLTLTTMSNGARQDLPQVSYIKAMDIWQTFSQALIFLVLLEYSFVSYFFTRRSFDCSHRSLNSECSRRLQTKQGDGTTAEEANRAAGNELKERGGRRQTKPAEMNNNNNIHAAVRRRCQPTETVQSKSAVSATVPPKMEEAFSTEIGTSSEGKRRRFCRMNNMREEHQMMGRNHSEEGILMGLGMMEEERGEGVPMPPREKGVWDCDEEDGRGAGRSWRSTGIGTHCQQCQWEDEMRGRAIDRYSRALFPTIFFSFCLAYWLYYWVLMNHE